MLQRSNERMRAVSWWLTWDDMKWPDQDVVDRIRRRADEAAKSRVNTAIIFGAHFRWDFLPLWSRLHDLIAFIREELAQRAIRLFDHHSSVLTHRPRSRKGAWNIAYRNRHHVPFYPSLEAAAEWRYQGKRLNDWRMIDVATGEPLYLSRYEAEQFCMNNPDFRAAYQSYLRKLIAETQIDGLMSDDALYYGSWAACGCRHCRERFRREYGHTLPPVSDESFWGNRDCRAFQDWIEMRFRSTRDFLAMVRETVGDLPLMTCCSGSESQARCATAITYQDFAGIADLIMLEMCGNTPAEDGTWDARISSQALHLAVAREAGMSPLGLGYGFYPDAAFFIWACNKFLGSDCWFSTLKGRLGPESQLAEIADDTELVREAYVWESRHPRLFQGELDAQVAVLFSRDTRDYYGRSDADYVTDFRETCNILMQSGIDFEVVTRIPEPESTSILVLSSIACLADGDAEALRRFLEAGGTVIASGPFGYRDGKGALRREPWTEQLGLRLEVEEPARRLGYPPFQGEREVAVARGWLRGEPVAPGQWVRVAAGRGTLWWSPARVQERGADLAQRVRTSLPERDYAVVEAPAGWYVRSYRAQNRILLHSIPARVEPVLHEKLRNNFHGEHVITKIRYKEPAPAVFSLRIQGPVESVTLFSPDLPSPRSFSKGEGKLWRASLDGVKRYFVVEVARGAARPG